MENLTMKATLMSVLATMTLLLAAALAAGQEQSELKKKANSVRATAAEMKFMEIPWITDLFEGFRLAKVENRPVFLYMITGDPLDDC